MQLQRDLTEPRSTGSPLKTLCNETHVCDGCVGSNVAWLLLMLALFFRIGLQECTSASLQAAHLVFSPPLVGSIIFRSSSLTCLVSNITMGRLYIPEALSKHPDCLPPQQMTPHLYFTLAETFSPVDSSAPPAIPTFLPLSFLSTR